MPSWQDALGNYLSERTATPGARKPAMQ